MIQNDSNLVGLSFIIKNILILTLIVGYLISQFRISRSELLIEKKERKTEYNTKESISSLDEFLYDEELKWLKH